MLVDGSASMETRAADGSSRRERGLAEARRLLGSRSWSTETGPPSLAEAATTLHAAGIPVLVVTDAPLPELPAEAGVVQITDGARNAGIVSAGFDPETGLLVRVEADPGAGARTLVIAADDRVLEKRRSRIPTSFRIVLPPEAVAGARVVTMKLEPHDALALDDEVTLVRSPSPVRVSVAGTPPPSIERALRAVPGVEIVHGGGGESAITLLVAPLSGQGGFETGAPVARDGAVSGTPELRRARRPRALACSSPVGEGASRDRASARSRRCSAAGPEWPHLRAARRSRRERLGRAAGLPARRSRGSSRQERTVPSPACRAAARCALALPDSRRSRRGGPASRAGAGGIGPHLGSARPVVLRGGARHECSCSGLLRKRV